MKNILCFGDSNTWGFCPGTTSRYSFDVRWTGVLQRELGDNYRVIEEGLNGRTTVWDDPVDQKMSGRDYLRPCLESHAPLDLVISMLGTNDLKCRFAVTAEDIAIGVLSLVRIVRQSRVQDWYEQKVPKILVLIPPTIREVGPYATMFTGGEAKSKRLAVEFTKIFNVAAYPDDEVMLLDTSPIVTVSEIDGLHLAPEQHLYFGKTLAAHVRQMIKPDSPCGGSLSKIQ